MSNIHFDPMLDGPGDGAKERNKSMDEKLKSIPEVEPDEIDLRMIQDAEDDSGVEMYVKYHGDTPVAYAYGESWVAQALFMDDIGYPTEEEARLAWEQRQKMRKEVEDQLG